MREITMNSQPLDVAELELTELEKALVHRGAEKFHAHQLYRWIYRRGVTDFERLTDLSRTMRSELCNEFVVPTPRVVSDERSIDGTRKFVFELVEGRRIESVFIP